MLMKSSKNEEVKVSNMGKKGKKLDNLTRILTNIFQDF
jgi:hypothetical protein